ncbi:MAG: hypothetical protein WC637_15120 [Victivallales bacterium]|jgi:hypothetical protein
MRMTIAVLILSFFTAAVAEARIGETFDQCVKRYGAPVASNAKLFDQRTGLAISQFKKEGVPLKVIFNSGKAVYVEYDYSTLKLETGEASANIIKRLLDSNGKDWAFDKSSIDREWLLEDNDGEGVIASDKIEPGLAKDRWVCGGGPEKGGLIAVNARIFGTLIIVNAEYMELVLKNQPKYFKERETKVKKALDSF